MSTSHLYAKPCDPVSLPRFEEFHASFSSRVRNAQSEEELRSIGMMIRQYLEQRTISYMQANSLWDAMQERSHVLQDVARLVDVVRSTLVTNTDVLQEVWKGHALPSHGGRPVTRSRIPEQCHQSIDSLAEAMRGHCMQRVQIGSTQFQIHGTRSWAFVPHVVPTVNLVASEDAVA